MIIYIPTRWLEESALPEQAFFYSAAGTFVATGESPYRITIPADCREADLMRAQDAGRTVKPS